MTIAPIGGFRGLLAITVVGLFIFTAPMTMTWIAPLVQSGPPASFPEWDYDSELHEEALRYGAQANP